MKHTPVPGFIDKVHAKQRQAGIDCIPVAGSSGLLNFNRINIEHNGQQGNHVPFKGRQISEAICEAGVGIGILPGGLTDIVDWDDWVC